MWSRLVSGALDYQLPDGLVDPQGGSPRWLSACRDEPSCPCNSCEGLIELSLNRYRLWLLVEAWSSLLWHLFIQCPHGVGHCGIHSLCGKASEDLEGPSG